MKLPWTKKWRPVSVLTGFLGSGKTTVLRHLLTRPEMARTALIINEFGEISVDHLLVENAEEKMVMLSNGCVCCSIRGDLTQAIRSLFTRMHSGEIPRFDRILIETTGLADPGPIVQSLIGPALRHFPVYFDSVATTIDASNALETIPQHNQMVSQIAVADALLLTKTDLARDERVQQIQSLLTQINPRVQAQQVTHGHTDISSVFGQCELDPTAKSRTLRKLYNDRIPSEIETSSAGEHQHGDIRSFVITRDEPLSFATFDQFMRSLQGYRGQDILRIKGLVHLKNSLQRPTVVHGVQGQMHRPTKLRKWPTNERRTQLVFITRNLPQHDVDSLLSHMEGTLR